MVKNSIVFSLATNPAGIKYLVLDFALKLQKSPLFSEMPAFYLLSRLAGVLFKFCPVGPKKEAFGAKKLHLVG